MSTIDILSVNLDKFFNYFNQNKYFYRMMMILMNLGSKYIVMDMSTSHNAILSGKIMRRVLIFTILFIATRDMKASLVMTAVFVVLVLNLFNDKSKFFVLPESYKFVDANMDGEITPDEIARAYRILKKTGKIKDDGVVSEELRN